MAEFLNLTARFLWFCFKRFILRPVEQRQAITYPDTNVSRCLSNRLRAIKRKTLVLSLNETLIHSQELGSKSVNVKSGTVSDFVLKLHVNHQEVVFLVYKRPHLDLFLNKVGNWYDLVIYTSSVEAYGAAMVDRLDRKEGILSIRYYRQHCTYQQDGYKKDLSSVSSDLTSIFILDNLPISYDDYKDNAILIKSWYSDPSDTALLDLLPMLDALQFVKDVRVILNRNLHLPRS